ncbi:MAG: hypothetical protein K6T85_03935 [Gorillibacterium sp.]|nr:hypothetical protein [Gorillibacterium sp.]
MINNQPKLDERQLQQRNKIGNNCFMALFFLLFIQFGIEEMNIPWLAYPINVLVTMIVCMFYYLVRTISLGAYIGNHSSNLPAKPLLKGMIVTVLLLLSGLLSLFYFKQDIPFLAEHEVIFTILILAIIFIVFITVLAMAAKSRSNSNNGED